ncbi:hypothetical protein L596_019260 [Steinernema carpocapsae]|uniref:Uncharacterized protein n=1 Tax=Steinernema carpocapsae TaxID=34508 RepID=A0A4V6A0I0_STECR|nr:hypothetical protein L596_019260 [Steinernema carpocapsae]
MNPSSQSPMGAPTPFLPPYSAGQRPGHYTLKRIQTQRRVPAAQNIAPRVNYAPAAYQMPPNGVPQTPQPRSQIPPGFRLANTRGTSDPSSNLPSEDPRQRLQHPQQVVHSVDQIVQRRLGAPQPFQVMTTKNGEKRIVHQRNFSQKQDPSRCVPQGQNYGQTYGHGAPLHTLPQGFSNQRAPNELPTPPATPEELKREYERRNNQLKTRFVAMKPGMEPKRRILFLNENCKPTRKDDLELLKEFFVIEQDSQIEKMISDAQYEC